MKDNLLACEKISPEDLEIFRVMDEPEEIIQYLKKFGRYYDWGLRRPLHEQCPWSLPLSLAVQAK